MPAVDPASAVHNLLTVESIPARLSIRGNAVVGHLKLDAHEHLTPDEARKLGDLLHAHADRMDEMNARLLPLLDQEAAVLREFYGGEDA